MSISLLFDVFVFLVAACVVVPLAARFKLGSVLGYLAAGIAIGPFGLELIGHSESIMHFAEFGVVMMLFIIGLEMEPAVLWRLRRSIVGLGGLQVLVTMGAFTAIGLWMGYSWQISVTVSMALALSSTALVLQMLQERHLMNTTVGQSSFAVLLFQDIAVIPFLILIPFIATTAGMHAAPAAEDTHNITANLPAWGQALAVALAIAVIIFAGRYLLYYLFREVARTRLREVFVALSLALVVGVALLMQWVGASPALGVFIAGVVLANSEYRHSLENDIEPFKGLLLGLFFISVGMGIDFDLFEAYPQTVLALVIGLIAVKAIVLFSLGNLFGLKSHNDYMFALALSQGGEFGFVILKYIAGTALLPELEINMLVLVVALSIASTPIIMLFYSRIIAPRLMYTPDPKEFDAIDEQHPIIIAGFGRFGQVIGRFLAGKGVAITVLENDPDQINLLRKFGYKGYYGDATRPDMLYKAGAERARVLIVAVDDPKASLDIVRRAKKGFPHLTVFARAHNRQHAYELHKLGVDYFKRELFDSSLTMAQDVMVHLGRDRDEIAHKAKLFQHHDEATLRESFAFFENEPMLVDFAKTRREELERILRSDVEDHDRHSEELERTERSDL
jgi:glutathione-regulated potassium-efflux system ancillary protein KefC